MSENAIELLPCPFCGFVPHVEDDDCVYPVDRELTVYGLNCYEIGGGCGARVLGESTEDVIQKWNTRVKF